MSVSSPSELVAAIVQGNLDLLLGTQESEWLDFKGGAPALNDSRGKWRLARNVAAVANKGLGYIVFGIETQKHANGAVEAASRVALLQKDSVDVDACRQVIQSFVYPPIADLKIALYPATQDVDEALLVVEIVPQDDSKKPFVLKGMTDEAGRIVGAIGIPIRDGAQTRWWSAEEVHELITHGMRRTPPRLPAPNLAGSRSSIDSKPVAEVSVRGDQLVDRVEEVQEWESSPLYALMAMPNRPTDLVPSLYGDEGLATLLADVPSIRSAGFNLRTAGRLESLEGAVLTRVDNLAVVLDRSGVLVAAVPGDRTFLQWGINDSVLPRTQRINTLTLAEFTLEFFRFAEQVKARSEIPDWTCRLVARRFKSAGVVLDAGLAQPGAGQHFGKGAQEDERSEQWSDQGTQERNATRALTYMYALFERGPGDFAPFTKDGEINADAIITAANELR